MFLVFLGNCQVQTLYKIYETFVSPSTGDECRWIASTEGLDEAGRAAIERADILVEQHADFKPRADLSALTVRAKRHVVPVAGAGFLWPCAGIRHPESIERYRSYDPFRAEMADSWLNRQLRLGVAPDEAVSRLLALDIVKEMNLERRYEMIMNGQRARDAATGYRVADVIDRYLQEEQLFLTPFHPTLRISRYLALTFLEDLGASAEAADRVDRLMTDSFYLKFALPIHPGVAKYFGLAWADENTRYRFHDEGNLTFAEFAGRYMRCEANGALHDAMLGSETSQSDAARRIEQALAATPDSPWGLRALAKARFHEGREADALLLVRRALLLDRELDWGHFLLGQCLQKLGAPDEAEAAFREEIRLRPFRHAVHHRFARFLADLGRHREAAAAIAAAIELDPRPLEYHRFRDHTLAMAAKTAGNAAVA